MNSCKEKNQVLIKSKFCDEATSPSYSRYSLSKIFTVDRDLWLEVSRAADVKELLTERNLLIEKLLNCRQSH